MALNSATMAHSLRCCPAGAAIRRSLSTRAGSFLGCPNYSSGRITLKMARASPAASAPAPEPLPALPPLPWWAEDMLAEDDDYFPLTDVDPAGQGREELSAIWGALVASPLESTSLALREIMAAGNVFRCRSFHAGVLSGALLVLAGVYQLWQVAPTLFLDVVLGYMFYKLSDLAAELKRNGRANDICARIQLVLLLILSFKDNSAYQGFYGVLVDLIWTLNIYLYIITVYYEFVGIKHLRIYWLGIYRTLRTKGGLMKVVKLTIRDMFGWVNKLYQDDANDG
ncbi:hypothetical protein CFC21_019657 [Triticum aestivum]|uniref:Uncharacterized protein n=4 Tax=Triticum TaxID=4564 RepID=A0A9R1RE69_TRITD|nr:uncharacterized protein LOC123186391 [Triticum aestivum]KAF7004437.1 hypothetical protein CFC21_019657 [Triticum aestivum]VAH38062.1 unnamed protein product [Triticum turgidum subsp. durum]